MKIEHIALYVKDLETARSFFVKYLGAKSNEGYHNLKTSFRSYFLSFDDGARLEIMNKPEMPDFPKEFARTGYAHIAFSVGSKEKVDALTAELKAFLPKQIQQDCQDANGYHQQPAAEDKDFSQSQPRHHLAQQHQNQKFTNDQNNVNQLQNHQVGIIFLIADKWQPTIPHPQIHH